MKTILTRLLWLPVVLWAVATLTFFVLRIVPGNMIDSVSSQIRDPEAIARARAEWGIDQPLGTQYLAFIGGLARGDLGISMASGIPLSRLFFERLPPTIELALVAMLFSSVIGVGAGVLSAISRHKPIDYTVRIFSILGLSLPLFWVAILLIIVFAVELRWLPVGNRIGTGIEYETITNFMLIDTVITGNWEALGSFLRHLILPALAIGLTSAGFVGRLTRSAMLEVIRTDYIRTARAKGLSERLVIGRHALRNVLLPIITLQGLQFGTLLGGAVITEVVFTWPGLGRTLLDGILKRDYAVVQGMVIFVAFAYVAVNMLVDFTYHLIDPRLRHE
jgi:peptide/nickel transport system permease protein